MVKTVEELFPGLQGSGYQFTSPKDRVYNCIAWAAGDTGRWWWPDVDGESHWPAGCQRVETVAAFQEVFATLGYEPCEDDGLEPGFEKIALFATKEGLPKHAARQLAGGRWTSKLGELEDIEHGLHDLAGVEYGSVVVIMKRPLPGKVKESTMQVTITAVGPDNRGLADPIVHHVTSVGANIAEIQMYDHDAERLFAMLLRMDWPADRMAVSDLREKMREVGREKGLSVRTWARDEQDRPARLALCVTHRPEPPLAVLRAVRDGRLKAAPAVVIGNRPTCRAVAEQFGVDWHMVGDDQGNPDNERLVELFDQYEVDYIVLARYMRLIPPSICWKFAGGRIINLHHGLLPAFPGAQPYHDAYNHRMLTYGATVHFIVPELDAGDQIIHQDTFTVAPGTPLDQIIRIGMTDHEPTCLVEGLRRVLDREVALRFHRVVPTGARTQKGPKSV